MHEQPEMDDSLDLHVRAAGRPRNETALLAEQLLNECWPRGHADRSEPVARGWLRMWGPVRIVVALPHCGCAHGRCTICN